LGNAGKLIYDDASKFYKIKTKIDILVNNGVLKFSKKEYTLNFNLIAQHIIKKNQEEVKDKQNWWRTLFTDDSEKYDNLKDFWNQEHVKRVFFNRKLILTVLSENHSDNFLKDAFCYFMELPIMVMILHDQIKQLEEQEEKKEIIQSKKKEYIKPNILYNLFMIGNYVEKLKELEQGLYYFLHNETERQRFQEVIELHKKFYYKGKKIYTYDSVDIEPKKTDLGFITALREFE
jgi:hypothetical protein